MHSVQGGTAARLRLRDAEAIYQRERASARERRTSALLRELRAWDEVADRPSDEELVRRKAVRAELSARRVRPAPRRRPW